MKQQKILKDWTLELNHDDAHPNLGTVIDNPDIKDSFMRAIVPLQEFAQFMDGELAKIRELTPFKEPRIKTISMKDTLIDLGDADHFSAHLKVDAQNRTFQIKFTPLLDVRLYNSNWMWEWSGPSTNSVEFINKRFNMAKLTMKNKISNQKELWAIQARLMKPYEALETEDRFTYPKGMSTIVAGKPNPHTVELLNRTKVKKDGEE